MNKSGDYQLGFISNQDIYNHVKQTISRYRLSINFKEFTKLKIDPIKASFDMAIYNLTADEFIRREIMRQIDKSNNNQIGYFHQNIFRYIKDWQVPECGYDIINENLSYYVEMKNKFNTMNSNSKENVYRKMKQTVDSNQKATCFLVEVIAKKSRNDPCHFKLDNQQIIHERIRLISIDKFYEVATGDKNAFAKLCQKLPEIINDVIKNEGNQTFILTDEINQNLARVNPDVLTALYLLTFKNYEGFKNFS
ncbi:Eco47II family restriction endonuclease [Parathermosynechococcus lividus]